MKPAAIGNQYIRKFIPPNQRTLEYIFNDDYIYHISEGTVRSAKTTDNILKFCMAVEKSPDIVHLTIAQTQSTAKTILWEGDGLGIAHYPDWQARTSIIDGKKVHFRQRIFKGKYQGHDALILEPRQGSNHPRKYIVAFGGSKIDSHEVYKGFSVGTWIATQWELLHKNTRDELRKRTIASQYRRHILDLNPTAPEHELYKEFELWESLGLVNYIHKTLIDNPILTPEAIEQIKREYDPDSVDYQRDILGLRVAAEGLIYRVRDYNIIDDYDVSDYIKYIVVADPGVNHSATTFVLLGITKDYKYVDVLEEYYHKNSDKEGAAIKLPIDYALDYQEFIKQAANIFGRLPNAVLSDNDLTFVREFNRTKYNNNLGGLNIITKFRKEEINDRIKTGINLLWNGRLRFNKKCVNTIDAFRNARYDEKQKDKGKYVRYDAPNMGTKIDPIDATEYGITYFRHDLNRYKGGVISGN